MRSGLLGRANPAAAMQLYPTSHWRMKRGASIRCTALRPRGGATCGARLPAPSRSPYRASAEPEDTAMPRFAAVALALVLALPARADIVAGFVNALTGPASSLG